MRLRASGNLFGEVVAGRMRFSSAGRIASQCWHEIPKHFPTVTLDKLVVMPDHVHGIIVIGESPNQQNLGAQAGHVVGAQHAAPLHLPVRPLSPGGKSLLTRGQSLRVPPGSLGAIIRAFKSATTKRINEKQGTPGQEGLAAQLLRSHHPDRPRTVSRPTVHHDESGPVVEDGQFIGL